MHPKNLDAVAWEAARAISRRDSLARMGSAGLALAAFGAGAARDAAIAGKRKNGRKRARTKVKRTCRKQVGDCQQAVDAGCAALGADPELCRGLLLSCCDPLAACDAGASYACVFDALSTN